MTTTPIYPKATFYLGDLWGYKRIEVTNVTWRFGKHSQYENVPKVEYTTRGKRKPEILIAIIPLVILNGWDHPDPPQTFGPPEKSSGVRTTRRLSADQEWEHEFNAFLEGYLNGSKATVLADFRNPN